MGTSNYAPGSRMMSVDRWHQQRDETGDRCALWPVFHVRDIAHGFQCAISRTRKYISMWAQYRVWENAFPWATACVEWDSPGIPWRHSIPLVGFPGSCHTKLAWPWTKSTASMSDKKWCGVKLTYEQLSATANFIWFRQTFCLRRRSTSKISCSLLAILCFDRQGQGHEHARCKHISRG